MVWSKTLKVMIDRKTGKTTEELINENVVMPVYPPTELNPLNFKKLKQVLLDKGIINDVSEVE